MSTVIDLRRRRFLTFSTTVAGAAGAATASWPFIASWRPSERELAAGTSVVVDVSKIEGGQQITVQWRRKPVWVLRRTPEILATLETQAAQLRDPDSRVESQQPSYARNQHRSLRPEIFVAVGLCTHLGCVPTFRPDVAPADLGADWRGGYFCPCHGSRFDLAGRVFKGAPAPINLLVPPYRFLSVKLLEVGADPDLA